MNWRGFLEDIQLICLVFVLHNILHASDFNWIGLILGIIFVLLVLYLKHENTKYLIKEDIKDV